MEKLLPIPLLMSINYTIDRKNILFEHSTKRIELKDVFKSSHLPWITKNISTSKFRISRCYPDRKINSIYFDNSKYSSLEESIEGNSIRKKIRLRWYGTKKIPTPARLEIKNKRGLLSWKNFHKARYEVFTSAKSWPNFIQAKEVSVQNIFPLKNLAPKSIVSYDRSYFSSFDKKIRVTIDRNIKTFSQIRSSRPNFKYGRCHLNLIILEIKIEEQNHKLLDKIKKDLHFTSMRFSKYCESLVPQKYF